MPEAFSKPVKTNFSAINDSVDFAPHSHDYYEIVMTIENNFIHTVNGESFCPRNGDVVILRPSDVHSARPVDDSLPRKIRDVYITAEMFTSCCSSLSPELLDRLSTPVCKQPPSFHLSSSSLSSLDQRLSYPFFRGDSDISQEREKQIEMIERSIVTELLGYYLYESFFEDKQLPECIIRLMNALQSRRFSRLRIEDMASELGYNYQPQLNCR